MELGDSRLDEPYAPGVAELSGQLPIGAAEVNLALTGVSGAVLVDGTAVTEPTEAGEHAVPIAVPLDGRAVELGCSGGDERLTLRLRRGGELRAAPGYAADGGEWGSAIAVAGGHVLVGGPRAAGVGGARHSAIADGAVGLDASGGGLSEAYGAAVALGDELLVIGIPGAGGGEGAVEIYRADGAGWALELRVGAPDPGQLSVFGAAVAVVGDEVWVGAPGLDPAGAGGAGAVYRLAPRGGTWTVESTFAPADLQPGEALGSTLAVGRGVVYAGAPGRGGRVLGVAIDTGAAAWLSEVTGAPGERLGSALAFDGQRLYIGGPGAACADGAPACGRVVDEDGAELRASSPTPHARFGAALAAAPGGDLLAVGAPAEGRSAGAVHLVGVGPSLGMGRRVPGEGQGRLGAALAFTEAGELVIGAPHHSAPVLVHP